MKKLKVLIIILTVGLYSNVFSQNEEIKLTILVKDENKNSIPGAIILIDDVKQSRVANSEGQFKIKLDKAPKTITAFSAIVGVKKVNYVDGQNEITIIISKGNDFDVVSNTNDKMINSDQFSNIYDYIRGAVAGVHVEGTTINIRGYNSINGNMTPLFILNGAQVDQSVFGQIIPLQIKNIYILKGNETSKYGVRGANGVIVVETK